MQFPMEDFVTEFKFSLWTDLCGEQTEFIDALEYISSF
jgi:hypothetical protein